MLRSKQLLPIYKGARTWLVAGTTCGSRTNSSDGNSHPNFDEQRSEGRCSRVGNNCADSFTSNSEAVGGLHISLLSSPTSATPPSKSKPLRWQRSASQETSTGVDGNSKFDRRTTAFYKSSTADHGTQGNRPSANNAAISQVELHTHDQQILAPATVSVGRSSSCSRKDSRFQQNVSRHNDAAEVGLAAVGHLSHHETDYDEPRASVSVVQQGHSVPNFGRRSSNSDHTSSSRRQSSMALETNSYFNPRGGEVKVSHKHSSQIYCQSSAFNHGISLAGSQDIAFPGDYQHVEARSKVVPHVHHASDFKKNDKDSFHGSASCNSSQSRVSCLVEIPLTTESESRLKDKKSCLKGKGKYDKNSKIHCDRDNDHHFRIPTNGAHRAQHKACTIHQLRDGRRLHSATNISGSMSVKKEIVERVCDILAKREWGHETVQALSDLDLNLSPFQINEVLKQQKDTERALNFFNWARDQRGYKHDAHTYTTMLGILGRARNFEALDCLFNEMLQEGCKPSIVTYNRLIHSYGRANYLEASRNIFNHMHTVGCKPDRVTYGTLIDLHTKAGCHDTAVGFYDMMQQAGYCPDTFTYSIMIHCFGKAGKLTAAYRLFREMVDQGYPPSLVTYNTMIDHFAKAGKFDMAMKLYNDMKEAGYRPDQVTYSIMMEVLGHSGHVEEAELVLFEMEQAGWTADAPIYGLMVDLWGKSGNAEKAVEWFNKMIHSGVKANVPACNSLLSAYLRLNSYNAARQVLQSMSKWGLDPSLQTYTLLLSCCKGTEQQQQIDLMLSLKGRIEHPAHAFLCSFLTSEPTESDTRSLIRHFFDCMQFEEQETKRGFADSLIDFLHDSGLKSAAGHVWDIVVEKSLYPRAVTDKTPHHWSVNLHVMSIGTALVALLRTLVLFKERMVTSGVAPERVDIITGWGRRSRVAGASLVKHAVESLLNSLGSPFHIDGANLGCFVSKGKPLFQWLTEPQVEQVLVF